MIHLKGKVIEFAQIAELTKWFVPEMVDAS
jgi:hypothetical protein